MITTTSETGSFYGKIDSFVTRHQTMTRPTLVPFDLFLKLKDFLNYGVDYQLMRDMYLTEPASFDDILNTLSDLEQRINLINAVALLRRSSGQEKRK